MSLPDRIEAAQPDGVHVQNLGDMPSDPVFDAELNGLVWIPSLGMGRLRTHDDPYDGDYFANYERLARSAMGAQISDARVSLVRRHLKDGELLVDVGIGCGSFVDAARTAGIHAFGYDVNMTGIRWLHDRHLFHDPYREPVDALTLWDVLEHVREPRPLLEAAGKWVFCSLPIVPDIGPPTPLWRHYKPREHCWYWTRAGFIGWMAGHGFKLVEKNRNESDLGRLDIESFAFRRVAR